jgi:hypothetical protein
VNTLTREGITMNHTERNLQAAIDRLRDALDGIDADSIEATKLDTAMRLVEEVERTNQRKIT